jgi:hypothetical protein
MRVLFTSPIAGYIAWVREEDRQYFPDGNYRVKRPALFADFAEEAIDETYRGQEGEPDYVAMRGGGFFDTDVAAKRHGWNDEEKKAVEERLLEIADASEDVRVYEPAKPIPPWPNFDSQEPDMIVLVASSTGLANAAIVYEQRTEKREDLIAQLQEVAEQQAAEHDLTAA